MSVIRSFFISLSIYSKIPVPQFSWREEDMRYTLCFFPWVGVLIGLLAVLWHHAAAALDCPDVTYAAVGVVIPLVVSGGFHVDGFMDTADALHSYRDREKKLAILKDSHVGAFAVICLVMYVLIYAGAFAGVKSRTQIFVVAGGYVLSRILSGIGVVSLRCAKGDGMLYQFASGAHRKIVRISLYLQLLLCIGFLLYQSVWMGGAVCLGAAGTFWYYRHRSYREFGGITGDTAGWFVTLSECVTVVIAALCGA